MIDPRHQKLAQVLIRYSLNIQPGEKLLLHGTANAAPLLKEVYREALRAGAHVHTRIIIPELREVFLGEATDEQLSYISEIARLEVEYPDAVLFIEGDDNTRGMSSVNPQNIAKNRAARREINSRFDERDANGEMRWCLTIYPTNAHAQDAGMSLEEYENFVFNAGLLNYDDPAAEWRKMGEQQQHIVDYLMEHDTFRVVVGETDITYRAGGRKWLNADGKVNFPDGEVFTAPLEDATNGTVHFTYPATYNGNTVEDVRLTFKDGKVVEASAGRGQDFLLAMLNLDEGARILGEAAFGTNYGIQRFTGETLFDEKIGGTMHLALGAAYKGCGGTNESGLHWDMVCNLREGKVYADGELCYENGKFII